MKFARNKKGQFIVIAVLMIAIMMISLAATIFSMGTYYKQEQWEEYMTLIEHVKQNTADLVDISLAAYTEDLNNGIMKSHLDLWQNDLRKAYPGHGIILTYDLAGDVVQAYGTSITYDQGLACQWNDRSSFSAANTSIIMNITSIGLEGYRFVATSFLNLTILNVDPSSKVINATVFREDGMPVTELKKENFQVEDVNITAVTSYYNPQHMLVYLIRCDDLQLSNATLTVWDQRGIKVVAAN
jgi:hypothetical protein